MKFSFLTGNALTHRCLLYAAVSHACRVVAFWRNRSTVRFKCKIETKLPLSRPEFDVSSFHLKPVSLLLRCRMWVSAKLAMEFHPKTTANFLAIRKDLYASATSTSVGRLFRATSSLASGNVTFHPQHETRLQLLVSQAPTMPTNLSYCPDISLASSFNSMC